MHARWVLVVDPIDGTRPAMAGFEAACVSVALAELGDGEPTMGDVVAGCDRRDQVRTPPFTPSAAPASIPRRRCRRTPTSRRMFWTYGLRGRPARETIEVLAELIDASSVGGATFDLGSATYDMTRIATGQLDAYVEPGPRIVADVPGMREQFERVGGGAVLNNSPYDLAAAAALPRGGGRGGQRRLRRLARDSAACSAPASRVPDVLRRRRQRASCTPRSCARSTRNRALSSRA